MRTGNKRGNNHQPGCKCPFCRAAQHRKPQTASQTATRPVSQPDPQPVTQSASQADSTVKTQESQTASRPVTQPEATVKTPGSQSVSQPAAQPDPATDALLKELNSLTPPPAPEAPGSPDSQPPTAPPADPGTPYQETKKELSAAGAKMLIKSPFRLSNIIFKTKSFTLDKDEEEELAQEFIGLAKEFGWEFTNKYFALFMFLIVGVGGTWADKFVNRDKTGQKTPEKKDNEPIKATETKTDTDPLSQFPKTDKT